MSEFEKLVSEQMKIMERDAKLDNVQEEIATRRKDRAGIQELFQRQTEQVIQSYRSTEKPSSYVQK